MEQTRSQRFIQEYARLMKSSAEFFNKDSVLMSREDYDNAKLRVLVVFPSPASTKAVSMTAAVLNDYVISSCPGVFIDFAYVPEQDDLKYYDKANMPYAIGNVTHLDASHFDIVGFSISILFESISVAWIMNSFTRCDKPLPLTWSERKDKKLSEVPVFYAGGITCSVADILFGELGDGRQAFLDYLHLGEFHCSKLLFDHYLVSREKGRTVQEMIDSFWKEVDFNDWLYQPQAYQVEFNDKNQIVKNVKINPNAPDMCKPYYPDEMPKEMGAARGIVMGNGVNAGLGQILAANGCSRSGFCNFSVAGNTMLGTVYGLVPIENLVDKGCQKLQSAGVVTCKDILRQKDERVYRVTLESGVYLDCSSGHKWIRAIDHKKGNKEKTYTTRQLANIVNKGGEFVVLRKIGNHFGVEWHSDLKVINLREESMLSQDEKCYQYTVSFPYYECCEMINDLAVRLNFYGFDTGVLRYQDKTVIEWWPMPNCATYDRVVAVEALAEVVPMYDVFDTDDHTVCYNGVITHQCHEGAYTGGWVENTPERLVELAKLCRKHTASTTLKAYSFNCVAEDTPVITNSGICRASELSGNELVATPLGYSSYILNKGKSDSLVNLIMSQGADLKITPNHRQLVFTENGVEEKLAKNLSVGDWVPFTIGTAKTVAKNSIYFALGLWYGDGNSSGNSNYFVFNDREVGNANNILPWISKEVENTKGDNLHVFLATKEFTSLVRSMFPNGKDDIRNLYNLGIQELVDFIQGLFDADGCGSRGWLKFTQKSSRKELLNFISTVLLSLGIRTAFSKEIAVNLEGYDREYYRYDLKVVGQESRVAFLQTFHNHVGKLDSVSVEDSIWNKDKCLPPALGVYLSKEFVRVFGKVPSGFNRSKFFRGVKGITVGKFLELFSQYKHDIKIVNDIVNGTRFSCIVAIENLHGDFNVVDVCETSGGVFNIAGFWTHNSNYLSDYKRNIYDWLGVYPRVTFNNMRLEELGLDKDALKMMKLAGYQRMTAPLEGISERIRNNLLNKNLSEKALDSYLEYGMMMGAVDCKVGIVLTGYEEEQDWQAFYDFNMKWRKKCHDMGGNIPFRYKCTLAVHYPHCLTEEALTPYPGTGLLRQNEHKLGKVAGFEDSEVTEVSEPFVQKAYTLTTTRGQQITGNFEHPVLTSPFGGGKWELMGNLKKGQTIYMKIGTKCYGDFKYVKFERPMGNRAKIKKLDFCLNPRWAEVLGWYCGDGFIHEGESLQFGLCYNKSEREILERHREVLETMFFDVSVHEYDSIDKLVVNSTLLCEWVKKEFGSKFDGKKISKLILTSPEVVQSSFLRGVFSADGTCGDYKEGSSIRLGMSNEQFIRDVQAMLMNMGIDCCVSVSRSGRKNPKWSCHVRRQYITDYLELIGFQGQKSVRGLSTAKLGKHSDLGFIRVKVRSVEEVGERTLWGLTVNNHAYVTNGIVSHNTPIEYIERRAAKHAYFGTYIMPNEWNEKYYSDHIRIKLNGFKHSTFIEQAIVDLGRYATPWMYNYIIRPGYPFYNTKTIVTHEEAWEAFKGMINPDYFFNERKMDEYISICHRIHIAMHANVIFQAKKILKDGANATPTIRCLKTYEGCPVDCKAHVYEKSPLITYGDAWLDESGKLTGKVWEEVKGCQRCKTPADRKKVLARELPMSKNADDILMYKAPSLELRLRFRIQRKKEYEVLSPRNTAFVFFTKFLRKSEELCKVFWELDAYHNMFWQSEEDKTYVVSGQQIVDVTFTDRKAKEIVESLIQEVNAEANSFRVVSVREVPLTDKIKVDDFNVFYFESTLSAEFWQFAAMNYDGEVKVEGAQGAMETIKDVRLTAPSFTLRDKVKGYFTVPCKYSPWHYLQGLMAVRRISLSKLLATTSIQCITTVRESNGTCMCGKEKAVSDIGTNMQQKVGRDCLAAFLTSKL